jgi:hypothetical protein
MKKSSARRCAPRRADAPARSLRRDQSVPAKHFQPTPGTILDVLRRKCAFKNIQVPTFDTIKTFFDELSGDWVTMLNHQLPALPPLNSFWDVLAGTLCLASRWGFAARLSMPPE